MFLKNLKILTLNFVDLLDLVRYGWEMRAWDRQFTSRRDSLRSRQVAISRSSHRESSSRQSLLNLFELVQVSLDEPAKFRIKQVKKIELNFFTFSLSGSMFRPEIALEDCEIESAFTPFFLPKI